MACLVDFTAGVGLSIQFACIDIFSTTSATSCSNTLPIIIPLVLWPPGAVIAAPFFGITAILLEPAPVLSRVYASWSRLAIISMALVVGLGIYGINTGQILAVSGTLIGVLAGSRLLQCFLVDAYIALVEKIRWTRGWDGLSTSMYATKDKR